MLGKKCEAWKTRWMDMCLYKQWKRNPNLPIECLLNTALLYAGQRNVVQFDTTYYDDPTVRATIKEFVDSLTGVVVRLDASGNIILYLTSAAMSIEETLKERDGSIEGGFQSTTFARMLDEQFYMCEEVVNKVLERTAPVRVGIFVISGGGTRMGAILVQMCSREELALHTKRLYERFLSISIALEAIDPELQTELCFYTKPGMWKESPEYVPCGLRELSPVVGATE